MGVSPLSSLGTKVAWLWWNAAHLSEKRQSGNARVNLRESILLWLRTSITDWHMVQYEETWHEKIFAWEINCKKKAQFLSFVCVLSTSFCFFIVKTMSRTHQQQQKKQLTLVLFQGSEHAWSPTFRDRWKTGTRWPKSLQYCSECFFWGISGVFFAQFGVAHVFNPNNLSSSSYQALVSYQPGPRLPVRLAEGVKSWRPGKGGVDMLLWGNGEKRRCDSPPNVYRRADTVRRRRRGWNEAVSLSLSLCTLGGNKRDREI